MSKAVASIPSPFNPIPFFADKVGVGISKPIQYAMDPLGTYIDDQVNEKLAVSGESPLKDGAGTPPAPPSPTSSDPAAAAKTNDLLDEAAKKQNTPRGRAATILTKNRGLISAPSTARRMLLGG